MAEDGGETGNRKLIPIVSRHGGGLDDYDYINIDMKGEIGTVEERMTKSESIEGSRVQKEGFVIESGEEEIEEPF